MAKPNRIGTGGVARTVVSAAAMIVLSMAASAQQAAPVLQSPARPATPAKTAAVKPAPKPEAAPANPESALRQRVDQLEEQLTEMQVTVGTLDSLAKGGASSSSGVYRSGGGDTGSGTSSADAGRIAVLETQVRALATQVDQLTQALRQASARQAAAPVAPPQATSQQVSSPQTASMAASAASSDPIGRLVNNGQADAPAPRGVVAADATAAPSLQMAGANDASSKQLYETAYGYMLQQDFVAAEAGFDDFLKRFPSDPLAGNAQYWLGESFFVRGQFKPAAAAFLKGYQTYTRSAKAPDSVLKLAMSLDKLGQKDAACASYSELTAKFPNAPGHVKTRADTERRRLGCA